MASNSKSIYCPNYSSSLPFTLSVSFSESSYSVTDNTSSLSLSASIKSGGVSFDTNYNNTLQIYWYDDNANSSGKLVKTYNVQDLSKNATASTSATLTVTHKADGSLSGYAKAVWTKHSSNSSVGYVPSSGNVSTSNTALTTIPRTSSTSLSVASCVAGTGITIYISRASTSFKHIIYYSLGGGSWNTIATEVADKYEWGVPMSFITSTNNTSTTCTIHVETYSGSTHIGTSSASFTVTPYGASTISSVSGNTIGEAMTINIARNNANFTHTLSYAYGNASETIATSVGASYKWPQVPIGLCSQTPNAMSGGGYLYLTTYYGSTKIGSTQSKYITLNVPSYALPTFSALNLTRVDNGVPSSWGVYVQGYSKVTASISGASGYYGSTITSYSISGGGSSTSSSSMTTGVLTSAKTYEFTAYVKDSRGRPSTEKKASITVYDYSKPSISVKADRCTSDGTVNSSGTYLKVTCTYKYASVNGKNSASVSVSCNGVSKTSFTSGTSFILNANCSISSMYTVKATITDGLGNTSSASVLIPTAERILNVNKDGNGIAFGGFSTMNDTMQIYYDLSVLGNVVGDLNVDGVLVATGGVQTGYKNGGSNYGVLSNGGNVYCRVTATTGWARGYYFEDTTNNNATICAFGAYGNGNKLNWAFIGDDWASPWISVNASGTELASSTFGGLTIFRKSNLYAGIKFRNTNGILGYLSIATVGGKLIRTDQVGGTDYEVIDSSGGTISGALSVEDITPSFTRCTHDNEHNFISNTNHMYFNYRTGSDGVSINSYLFYNGAGGFGSVSASNFNQSSDRKLKDNIQDINKAKEFILGLKPCEFSFKDGESKGKRKHMGFIAQEVSQLANELEMGDLSIYTASVISGTDELGKPIETYFEENVDDENLNWSLRYTEFIAPMVVTIQEQQKQIDELKKQINELKA